MTWPGIRRAGRYILAMSLLSAIAVTACSVVGIRTGTEEPRFRVVERIGEAEVREYAAQLAAETVVPGSAESARGEGFRRLAGYIFGGNAGDARIAMTAPVAQSAAGQKIAMTVPVTQAQSAEGWVIQFYLPAELRDPPAPRDGRVRIVQVPADKVAVLRFSGIATDSAVAAQRARLLGLLGGSEWAPSGPAMTWFYDPPWTLPPLRRNEVVVPVMKRPSP